MSRLKCSDIVSSLIVGSIVLVSVGSAQTTGIPAPPPGLLRVSAEQLSARVKRPGPPKAVLLWDGVDSGCPGCREMLDLAAHPPNGMEVIAVSMAHFTRNSLSQGMVNPHVSPDLERRVVADAKAHGIAEVLMAYPDSTVPDGHAFVEALGWKGAPFVPMTIFFAANGTLVGAKEGLPAFSVSEVAKPGQVSRSLTLDPPTRFTVAEYVEAHTKDPVTKLWATLAIHLARLHPGVSLLKPRDPASLIDTDPKDGRWQVSVAVVAVGPSLPATLSGKRKGDVVAVVALEPR